MTSTLPKRRVQYRIYIDIEKHTYDIKGGIEDVTFELTDFSFSYACDTADDAKRAAREIHRYAESLS